MSIASQYIRGKGVRARFAPEWSGCLGVVGGFLSPSISEAHTVSNTPLATEQISESMVVTVT